MTLTREYNLWAHHGVINRLFHTGLDSRLSNYVVREKTIFHLKTLALLKRLEYKYCLYGASVCGFITLAQAGYGFQDSLSEGSDGVLNAGSQTESVLKVGLLCQQLPVWGELWGSGQQGGDTVHKLWNQAGVGVIRLTEMVRHHLTEERGR